jgi:hypothetical protein
MSELWNAVWVGAVGAVVGAAATYLFGAEDRKRARLTLDAQREAATAQQEASQAQQKLVELEGYQRRLDTFDRFIPKVDLFFKSGKQFVRLEAHEAFHVEVMDYLNATGAKMASRPVNQNEATIVIPIDEELLDAIRRVGPWVNYNELSAHVKLRFTIRSGQQTKQLAHDGIIQRLKTDCGGGRFAEIVQIVG